MSRSYLFIPGNTPSMIQNLDVFEADAVIIDFEDSVIDYDKDSARDLVTSFLEKYNFDNTLLYIRVNDVESDDFLNDILSTIDLDINGYVLPKALPKSVDILNEILDQHNCKKHIIPIIESPMAVLRAEEIAVKKNVSALLLGAEDLTKELSIKRTLEASEILFTRSKIVLVANAYKIDSIDTPFTDKDNTEELRIDCLNAKQLGFTSKSLIHPNQVDVVNELFSPTIDEINFALKVIAKSKNENKGAFSLDGKMIDLPIIKKAKKTITEAKKYNLI
ncbi:MAG: CoA ester lyase [Candidatus Izemoplasma sp.]